MRGGAVVAAVAALAFCAPALAQVPLPPLPPIGGQPLPPGGQPPPNPPPAPPAGTPSVAGTVAYGANPGRTGQVADYTVPPPYQRRWGARTEAFQLLAAEGRVFEIGGTVRARALRSGRRLWRAGPFNEI